MTTVVLNEFDKLDPNEHASLCQALAESQFQCRGVSLAAQNPFLPDFAVECQPFMGQGYSSQASRWVGNFAIDAIDCTIQPRVGYPSCEGINPQIGDGPFPRGSGEVRMKNGSSVIQAWSIRLLEPKQDNDLFHDDIKRQLRHILKPLIAGLAHGAVADGGEPVRD